MRGLCRNVPQVEGEEFYSMDWSCEGAKSKFAVG